MYLTGAIELLRVRNTLSFTSLYMGKVSQSDSVRLAKEGVARLDSLRLPTFLRDEKAYRSRLCEIVHANGLSQGDLIGGDESVSLPVHTQTHARNRHSNRNIPRCSLHIVYLYVCECACVCVCVCLHTLLHVLKISSMIRQ